MSSSKAGRKHGRKLTAGRLSDIRESEEDAYELRNLRKSVDSFGLVTPSFEDNYSPWSSDGGSESDEEDDSGIGAHSRSGSFSYSPEEDKRVLRKLDRQLVLFVALLYLLSFLDRSNIGNARIAGMTEELRLTSSQYEWLLTAFYITYVLFEWMTLLYRTLRPHVYISICVASWGLIASAQCIAPSFEVMFILRALLGIAEAAYGPGVPFYLSFFFKREELALRTGLFISAAPLATSFASSLAWLIARLGQNGPISPWRLLFLVEGFPSVIVAVFAWYQIPDSPGTASFLDKRERMIAVMRLRGERKAKAAKERFQWKEVFKTLMDPKSYLTAVSVSLPLLYAALNVSVGLSSELLMFYSCNVAFASLPPFLPTIINEMEYSAVTSQALSAPPYLFSFALVLLAARLSDRSRKRARFVIASALMGAFGYAALALTGYFRLASALRYAAVFPAAAGFFVAITIIITWTVNNQASDEGKGTGVAMLNVIGQLGPLLGTRLYPDSDKPYYVRGMAACAGFMLFVAVLAQTLSVVLRRANARKAADYVRVGSGDGGMEPPGPGAAASAKGNVFEYII